MKGFNIVFIGVDGSGKGTYIKSTREHLRSEGVHVSKIYLGHNEYQLSYLAKLAAAKKTISNRFLRKSIRLLYYVAFIHELMVRQSGLEEASVTLIDRHPIFEPISAGNFIYSKLEIIYKHVSPKPDLIIYLTGDINTIWERKKEHDIDSLRSMNLRIRNLLDANDFRFIQVNTTNSSIAETKKFINDFLFKEFGNK